MKTPAKEPWPVTALTITATSIIANAATGWATAWLLNQAQAYNSVLWGSATISLLAVGLTVALLTSVHPVITATVFITTVAIT